MWKKICHGQVSALLWVWVWGEADKCYRGKSWKGEEETPKNTPGIPLFFQNNAGLWSLGLGAEAGQAQEEILLLHLPLAHSLFVPGCKQAEIPSGMRQPCRNVGQIKSCLAVSLYHLSGADKVWKAPSRSPGSVMFIKIKSNTLCFPEGLEGK